MSKNITVLIGQDPSFHTLESATALESRGGVFTEMDLDPSKVSREISNLLQCIEDVQVNKGHYEVSEVQFNLAVNSKGKIGILSVGAEAGLEAALKVTIKRVQGKGSQQ